MAPISLRSAWVASAGSLLASIALLSTPLMADEASASDFAPKGGAAVELITLGTGGGPMVRMNRAQMSAALKVADRLYLIDVGYGAVRQMAAAALPMTDVDAVFITHQHIDHTADLSALIGLRWVFKGFEPLLVAGPPGMTEALSHLVKLHRETELARTENGPEPVPMTRVFSGKDFPAETPQPALVFSDGDIRVFAMTNTHYHFPKGSPSERHARSYGLRIETPKGVIAFTGDSGPSRNLEVLAKGADILVSEVIDLDLTRKQLQGLRLAPDLFTALMEHMEDEHLVPTEVGKLAKAAGVKHVVLAHIAPGQPTDNNEAAIVAGIKSVYDGRVDLAADLDRFVLN